MGSFKNWLRFQEFSIGSDGMRDNTPADTARATNQVAGKYLANPQNATKVSDLAALGQQHTSAVTQPLMQMGANAIKFSPMIGKKTDAIHVASTLAGKLGIKNPGFKPPEPGKVSLMRKRMRRR